MLRCAACRTRRSTWQLRLKHVAATGHKVCECGQGRHYPHRPGSAGCAHEPWDDLLGQPRGPRWMPYQPIPF